MKNSSSLFLIHDLTASFTSSSVVKWTQLRSLFKFRKKWKLKGTRYGKYGGWAKGSNIKFTKSLAIGRDVCGSALSCCKIISPVDFRACLIHLLKWNHLYVLCRNSWSSQLQNTPTCRHVWHSRTLSREVFFFVDGCFLNFLECVESKCQYYMLCLFSSGS